MEPTPGPQPGHFTAAAPDANPGQWVEEQCRQLGISVSKATRAARINRTTILRWKKGETEPMLHTWRRVESVIKDFWDKAKP